MIPLCLNLGHNVIGRQRPLVNSSCWQVITLRPLQHSSMEGFGSCGLLWSSKWFWSVNSRRSIQGVHFNSNWSVVVGSSIDLTTPIGSPRLLWGRGPCQLVGGGCVGGVGSWLVPPIHTTLLLVYPSSPTPSSLSPFSRD